VKEIVMSDPTATVGFLKGPPSLDQEKQPRFRTFSSNDDVQIRLRILAALASLQEAAFPITSPEDLIAKTGKKLLWGNGARLLRQDEMPQAGDFLVPPKTSAME
jgi:hypothetical protein